MFGSLSHGAHYTVPPSPRFHMRDVKVSGPAALQVSICVVQVAKAWCFLGGVDW